MYVIFDSAQPHIALATGTTLDSIATLLAARREPALTVGANEDGLSRQLSEAEQREVDERVRELRSLAGEGIEQTSLNGDDYQQVAQQS
jgi:hypothetical protein